VPGGRRRVGLALVGIAVAGDQRRALGARGQPHAAQHAPRAVLGDPDATPLRPRKLGADPPRPVAGVTEREGDDALLEVGPDLVGHPRPPALAHVERLKTPPIDALFEAVVGRTIHAHRATRRRDVAQLVGRREPAKTESDEHVVLCHRSPLRLAWRPED
jgi:hypothetical protein